MVPAYRSASQAFMRATVGTRLPKTGTSTAPRRYATAALRPAFRDPYYVGSHSVPVYGVNHAAYSLAVYASQGGLLHHHARLASRTMANRPDGIATRGDPKQGFS